MKKTIRFVGLDVHQKTIVVAVAEPGSAPAQVLMTVPNDRVALAKCLDRIGPAGTLRICYEAGPTGYGLARWLNESGLCCMVVAPSLVPRDGSRVKTDRRDAVRLAHFLRSGNLVAVAVPDATTEAMRDLERAREDAKNAERVVRHQLCVGALFALACNISCSFPTFSGGVRPTPISRLSPLLTLPLEPRPLPSPGVTRLRRY
ncbi:MAG TPA: transposase, partial [Gemmataceae bacterium]|nr:transposase [Gemmataceae bacterium]